MKSIYPLMLLIGHICKPTARHSKRRRNYRRKINLHSWEKVPQSHQLKEMPTNFVQYQKRGRKELPLVQYMGEKQKFRKYEGEERLPDSLEEFVVLVNTANSCSEILVHLERVPKFRDTSVQMFSRPSPEMIWAKLCP
ncbi:hypothetical protein PR048_010710 [Dryococelus australis]|uniref:Uncharacterized protein n=1 Tax=Dryococelus australis TaxID=614101 RepID=A0ABQ9I3F6_9NEOP|nr:hypothetical protein PR048_010710 [Dryococelus australis]